KVQYGLERTGAVTRRLAGTGRLCYLAEITLNGTLHLHPRPLLPTSAREPLARGHRAAGLRPTLSRLERAPPGRVLRAERGLAHPRRRGAHPAHRQQLLAHQLQFRTDAPALAREQGAGRLPRGTRA